MDKLLITTAAAAALGLVLPGDATSQPFVPIDVVTEVVAAVPCCPEVEADDPPTPVAEEDPVKLEALWLARLYRHEHGFPHEAGRCVWNSRRATGELAECRAAHRARASYVFDDDMRAINAVIERVQRVLQRARERRVEQGKGSDDDNAQHEVTYVDAIAAYTRKRLWDQTRTTSDCDAVFLDLEGTEPERWCAHDIPWSRRREAWLATTRAAIDVRGGDIETQCTEPPLHWGCGVDLSTPPRGHGHCRDHERAARAGWCEVNCGHTINTFYAECGAVADP